MRVRILLFALYRDLAGTAEVEIYVPVGGTAREAIRALRARSESYGRLPEAPAIAVNEEYASLDAVLADGDELALIPPVAGG